jgi:hypothetical protein
MAGLLSLASALRSDNPRNRSEASIIDLDPGNEDKPYKKSDQINVLRAGTANAPKSFRFQYFPETISDTKQVNYQRRDVPGASLPIYQWVNSGERLISFTAVFSTDVNLGLSYTTAFSLHERLKGAGHEDRNVDIRAAVSVLRDKMMPLYPKSTTPTQVKAPPKLLLYLPGTGIGWAGGFNTGAPEAEHSVICIMTQCDVSWESFFPNGLPRLATVQLSFAQLAQRGGRVVFPSSRTTPLSSSIGYTLTSKNGVTG